MYIWEKGEKKASISSGEMPQWLCDVSNPDLQNNFWRSKVTDPNAKG